MFYKQGGILLSRKKKLYYPLSTLLVTTSLVTGCVSTSSPAPGPSTDKAASAAASGAAPGKITVEKTNRTFDTAGNMFAYAEFELSGEPLAEALGLDLDLLDAGKPDSPTPFDYAAGIESYEYSEEAMYEVVEKSGLGLHLVNGPINKKRAGGKDPREALAKRYLELAEVVGYKPDEIFQNMFPTFVEYASGDPHYIKPVDTSKFADGEEGRYIPKYQVDFSTLRWNRSKMEKTLTPSALGGTYLKQALWLGDFMGGLHTVDKDEEIEASAPDQDQDPNIRLGVSSADGLQGVFLTEGVWNKLAFIRDQLFIRAKDGKLGATPGTKYDPSKGLVYLPHAVAVTEDGNAEFPGAKSLKVVDKRSLLQDQWLMMWAASEFYGTTDQRPANPNKNPAFLALFDGKPFPSAPKENLDADSSNDVKADDPYSLNKDVLYTIFKNMETMHWNAKHQTLVSEHSGEADGQGSLVDTFQTGYAMEALRLFVRAVDGLPLGYASGDAAEGLHTREGERALAMIKAQADFMIDKLVDKNDGLVYNGGTLGADGSVQTAQEPKTLKAQLGAIRGLTAAFLATKDEKYRLEARKLFEKMTEVYWDDAASAYRETAGQENGYQYDAFSAGAVSAMFRLGLLNLVNTEADKEKYPSLEPKVLTDRYVRFFRTVINGPTLEQGMQASEFWDTGDFYMENAQHEGNTDGDTVPQIQAVKDSQGQYGIAPILLPVIVKKN
jgi:hypothetical protein